MEFYYYCVTCSYWKRNEPEGTPIFPGQVHWCVKHKRKLPPEVSKESLICCEYKPVDPRATEWQSAIAEFPEGELWTFDLHHRSQRFAVIADLPKVDPATGEVLQA